VLFTGLTLADVLSRAIALLIAITFHEFAHAWLSSRLGDQTARYMGRLTLNPLAHLDPIGTLMLLVAGFGWGKPVPVNPYNLRNGPRGGMALTSLAGPLSNLLLAGVFALPLRFGLISSGMFASRSNLIPSLGLILLTIVVMNVALAIFNLIPLPPLDGFSVLQGIVPREWAVSLERIRPYGPLILLGLFMIDRVLPVDALGAVMNPFINFFLRLYLGV